MSAELIKGFATCEMVNTAAYNELQIERARQSRYRSSAAPTVGTTPAVLRVLVVDDHCDGARVLEILIKRWGHECRIAFDGASGLALAVDFRPHVVLVDVVMPNMSGPELTVSIRNDARLRDSLIIALSGCTAASYRLECEHAGVDQYFIKPMSSVVLKTLLALEAEYVARQRAARRNLPVMILRQPSACGPRGPKHAPRKVSRLALTT